MRTTEITDKHGRPSWLAQRSAGARQDCAPVDRFVRPADHAGVVVLATFCIIIFNLVVDMLYAVVDPRIRLS